MDYRSLPDTILTRLLQSDDEAAFNELYKRYWKTLFNAAYHRIASIEDSREMVQHIFMRVWEKRKLTPIVNPEHYLNMAIKNSVINYFESKAVRGRYKLHILKKGVDRTNETEAMLRYNELSQAIKQAIDALPEKTAVIFKMSRFENLTVKEIANVLHISEKAVEYHITSSIRYLKVHLKDFLVPGCLLTALF